MQRAGHIDLQTLAGDEIFLCAGLASHLVDEGDALGLGREQIIVVLRRPCQQFACTGDGDLRVAEHDERADIQIVGHLAQRQIPVKTGNVHSIFHAESSPPYPFVRRVIPKEILYRPNGGLSIPSSDSLFSPLAKTTYFLCSSVNFP